MGPRITCLVFLWIEDFLTQNPGILDVTFFTDEACFHLSGYVNSQNTRMGSRKPSYCARRDLTDDELTTGYYQKDGATCHTSNPSMQGIESFLKTELSQKPFAHPDLPI